jgi:plasmid stability protein
LRSDDCNAIIAVMASLTIRNLDPRTKARLRIRAARHDRSMEEEAREILRQAVELGEPSTPNLAEAIHQRFAALGGVELEMPTRGPVRPPPNFRR